MPFDHNGQLVEAVDCASCNSSLEWHGRLPEDPADILCSDCLIGNLEAERNAMRDALEAIADGSCYDTTHDIRQIARAALTKSVDTKKGNRE